MCRLLSGTRSIHMVAKKHKYQIQFGIIQRSTAPPTPKI